MKLLSFRHGDSTRIGLAQAQAVIDLNRAFRHCLAPRHPHRAAQLADCWLPGDMAAFLEGGEASMAAAREALAYVEERLAAGEAEDLRALGVLRSLEPLRLLAPVPRPGKIFCIGKNYRDHALELGGQAPKTPEIFTRFPATLIAAGAPIVKPPETDQLDYEAELAVVIGRGGRRIPRAEALEHVAGYSCFNDVSARDFQKRITQWTAGKNFDHSGAFGPHLVTPDEVGDAQSLDIRMDLSGEILQSANTRDMIFGIDYLIAHLSEFITLSPGDVIVTGTPGGVGMARTPPRFLREGDVAKVIIERIGTLENPVVGER